MSGLQKQASGANEPTMPARARAWVMPAALNGWSELPQKRPASVAVVAPWRTSKMDFGFTRVGLDYPRPPQVRKVVEDCLANGVCPGKSAGEALTGSAEYECTGWISMFVDRKRMTKSLQAGFLADRPAFAFRNHSGDTAPESHRLLHRLPARLRASRRESARADSTDEHQ